MAHTCMSSGEPCASIDGMTDLSVDNDPKSPSYGDLLLIDGEVPLTSDADSRGTSYILQHILQRLRTYRGEWFLNKSLGVPYYQEILVKQPNRGYIDQIFQTVVAETPGVVGVTQFASRITETRVLQIVFQARTIAGLIAYDGSLNTPYSAVTQ